MGVFNAGATASPFTGGTVANATTFTSAVTCSSTLVASTLAVSGGAAGVVVRVAGTGIGYGPAFTIAGAAIIFDTTFASIYQGDFRPYDDVVRSNGTSNRRWIASWARAYYSVAQTPAFGATMNIDPSLGEECNVTLTNNLGAWTISAPTGPRQFFLLTFIQDGTGTRTIGTPPAAIKWMATTYLGATHANPVLTVTAGAKDTSLLVSQGTNWLEIGRNFNN